MGKRRKDGRAPVTVNKTTAAILAGEEDLSTWDDDELERGQRKDKGGKFRGRPPMLVPQTVHDERRRRWTMPSMVKIQRNGRDALEYIGRIVRGEVEPEPERLKAAMFATERAFGRAPQSVAIDVALHQPKWVQALTAGIVTLPDEEEKPPDVVDAEIVEDEYVWEEDPAPAQEQPRGEPHDSRLEQVIEPPPPPRTVPWGRGPTKPPSTADRREGRA